MPDSSRSFSPATDRRSYPLWAQDTIRYRDLDRQDHVNNAVYATFFETGRVKYFRDAALGLLADDETFVLARIEIDFLAELHFPGAVDIGVRILSVGRSSYRMGEAIFLGERCVATAEAVMAMLDAHSRKAIALTPRVTEWLAETQARQP